MHWVSKSCPGSISAQQEPWLRSRFAFPDMNFTSRGHWASPEGPGTTSIGLHETCGRAMKHRLAGRRGGVYPVVLTRFDAVTNTAVGPCSTVFRKGVRDGRASLRGWKTCERNHGGKTHCFTVLILLRGTKSSQPFTDFCGGHTQVND